MSYEFQEYPKWIYPANGDPLIVNNQDEENEHEAPAEPVSEPEPVDETVQSDAPDARPDAPDAPVNLLNTVINFDRRKPGRPSKAETEARIAASR